MWSRRAVVRLCVIGGAVLGRDAVEIGGDICHTINLENGVKGSFPILKFIYGTYQKRSF